MTFITKPTRTSKTEDKYESIYKGLEKSIRSKDKVPPEIPVQPASIALFFNENEGNWMPSTCRLYRAAIIHVAKKKQAEGDEWASGALEVLSHVDDGEEERISRLDDLHRKRKNLRSGKRRGPRQKVKRFLKEDSRTLVQELYKMRSPYGQKTATWFISAMLTGLRPCEWECAKFETNYQMVKVLVVENAKNSNGRAHSNNRRLTLSGVTEDQMRVIESHMREVWLRVEAGEFDRFYTNCRQTLQRLSRKLWPLRKQYPALYTARHMFAADAKSAFDQISVAAMMGHASIDTAGKNYAPAWSGRGGMAVEPSEEDVQAVTFLNQAKIEKAAEKVAEQQAQIDKLVDAIPKVNDRGGNKRGGAR